MRTPVDKAVDDIVAAHGFHAVLAALARHCDRRGMRVTFRRLNKIYEYLTNDR